MKQSSINRAGANDNIGGTAITNTSAVKTNNIDSANNQSLTDNQSLTCKQSLTDNQSLTCKQSLMNEISQIGIVGLGLIGGSLLRAIRRVYPYIRIVGLDSDKATIAAVGSDKSAVMVSNYHEFRGCQIIFVCVPVGLTAECVRELVQVTKGSALITDVASVKGMLASIDGRIIGGHPMAGTENSGYNASCDTLFERAPYILVDYGRTERADYELLTEFVSGLNTRVIDMNAADHDKLLAGISHLPHMIAYSLSNLIFPQERSEVAGRSLFDVTRIASSSPKFWREVTELNGDNILSSMDSFIEQLQLLRELIECKQFGKLEDYFAAGKSLRERHITK